MSSSNAGSCLIWGKLSRPGNMAVEEGQGGLLPSTEYSVLVYYPATASRE